MDQIRGNVNFFSYNIYAGQIELRFYESFSTEFLINQALSETEYAIDLRNS